jgi:hypothetical protein
VREVRNILAYAKQLSLEPIKKKSQNVRKPPRASLGTIMKIKKKVNRNTFVSAKILKKDIPLLAGVSVVLTIQLICYDKLKLTSHKMEDKPLETESILSATDFCFPSGTPR